MAGYRLSLIVNGRLTIEQFRDAVTSFISVLHNVDEGLTGRRSVRWRLSGLHHGSPATMTCIAEGIRRRKDQGPDMSPVVWGGVIEGVRRLDLGKTERPPGFNDDALEAIRRLALLRSRKDVTSIAITGENTDQTKPSTRLSVTQRVAAAVDDLIAPKSSAPGSVDGRLQGINSHGRWTFTVYESIWGGRVVCDLPDGLRPRAFSLFDQRVLVTGIVARDASGRPRHVRAEKIEAMGASADLPQSLLGLDPDFTGSMPTEEYVKKRWGADG